MNEMVKMVVVLTVLSSVAGGLLAAVHNGTKADIEMQQLEFVKGPAIKSILEGSTNDPIADRFKITDGNVEKSFFVGEFKGQSPVVAFEGTGKGGYSGDIGVMVGVNVEQDQLVGAAVTIHSETPGLGAKAKDEPDFVLQFKGLSATDQIMIKRDGGQISAISGATITSRAVCAGVMDALGMYQKLKPQIEEKIK
jgi:electron transport complex protein RnfG